MNTILVVEDDPFSQDFYSLILKKAGYSTIITDDVNIITELLLNEKISLIIMDINLRNAVINGEKVDGLYLSSLIKNDERFSNIPIHLVTAYSEGIINKELLRNSKADSIITKPLIDINYFISTIDKSIGNSVGH